MEGIFRTDTGLLRPYNEDNGAVRENHAGQILALVADGMGGHQAGDVASEMARDGMLNHWDDNQINFSADEAEKWLQDTVSKVNEDIYRHSQNNPECEGMGTTLVAAVCSDEFVAYSNVGDSRIYFYDENGLEQITDDHSLVGELVRSGQLSEEEAEHHPRKNVVMRALGTEKNIDVDVATMNWRPGAMLLLCSDGLTDMIDNGQISERLTTEARLDSICSALIKDANAAGGEDNITITLVRHETKDVSGT